MRERCDNPKSISYKYYGARGITYDSSWNDFKNFLTDMGERPENTTLDRIDVDGNYCKDNCRWSVRKVQNNTRRFQQLVTYQGHTRTIGQWADITGIHYQCLHARIFDYAWSIEKALTIKPRKSRWQQNV